MTELSSKLPDGIRITPVSAFSDNYIWCIHDDHSLVVVDPGDAEPVLAFCKQHELSLEAILITHHHKDHTGGIARLTSAFPDIAVIGPGGGHIRGLTKTVDQGDSIHLPVVNCQFTVIEVPGHTLDHIAFYGHGVLFCGDTLFIGGCGRLFEGSAGQMLHSLNRLKRLPDDTKVYCAHEYTLSNLKFAQAVEPENADLKAYAETAQVQRNNNQPTVPGTLATEKSINPFMRTGQDSVMQAAEKFRGKSAKDETEVFGSIRKWKDEF